VRIIVASNGHRPQDQPQVLGPISGRRKEAVRTIVTAHSSLQACSDLHCQSAPLQIWRLAPVRHHTSASQSLSITITVGAFPPCAHRVADHSLPVGQRGAGRGATAVMVVVSLFGRDPDLHCDNRCARVMNPCNLRLVLSGAGLRHDGARTPNGDSPTERRSLP